MGPSMRSSSAIIVGAFALCSCTTTPGQNDGGTDGGIGVDADPPDVGQPQCAPSACPSNHCGPDGACATPCTTDSDCASDETCCAGTFCSNLAKDPQNCGACGTACDPTQYCSGTSCFDARVNNLCQNAAATIVLDGLTVDGSAGDVIQSALVAACPNVKISSVQQGASGSIDPQSGRPLLGPGDTYVAAGGGYGQKAVGYVESARNAPVYSTDNSQSIAFVRTSNNATIVTTPLSSLTSHHDYFVIYAATEPVSGTLVFAIYGLYGPGTTAGAFWFKSEITAKVSQYTKQYYVYEWTDTNNDGVPNAQDGFKLVDSN
jgi:hypothetical protein